jgi:hypothetical protein
MPEEIEGQVVESPTGEVESPELAEIQEVVPATTEEDDELAGLQAKVDQATNDTERVEAEGRRNKAFAKIRKARKEAEEKSRALELQLAEEKGRRETLEQFGAKPPDIPVATPALQVPAPQLPPRPDPKLWTDDEGYVDEEKKVELLADWRADCKFIERDHKQEQEKAKTAQQKLTQDQVSFEQQGEAKYPGFVNKVKSRLAPILSQMPVEWAGPVTGFISKSPQNYELIVYLADNPAEMRRLTTLDAANAMREVIALEGKLKKPESKKTTNAPGPIIPLGGSDTIIASLDDIKNDDEWFARVKAEEIRRKRGLSP